MILKPSNRPLYRAEGCSGAHQGRKGERGAGFNKGCFIDTQGLGNYIGPLVETCQALSGGGQGAISVENRFEVTDARVVTWLFQLFVHLRVGSASAVHITQLAVRTS